MILFTSSSQVNSTIINNINFIDADLNNYSIYLILTNNINNLLFYNNSSLTSLNFIIFIDLIYIPCAIMPYIKTYIKISFPILLDQSLINYLSTSASSILIVLILRSLFFS